MNWRGNLGLQMAHVWRRLFGDDDMLEPGATQKIIANLRHGGPYAVKKQLRRRRGQHPRPDSLDEMPGMGRAQSFIDVKQRFDRNEPGGKMQIDACATEKLSAGPGGGMAKSRKHECARGIRAAREDGQTGF